MTIEKTPPPHNNHYAFLYIAISIVAMVGAAIGIVIRLIIIP